MNFFDNLLFLLTYNLTVIINGIKILGIIGFVLLLFIISFSFKNIVNKQRSLKFARSNGILKSGMFYLHFAIGSVGEIIILQEKKTICLYI